MKKFLGHHGKDNHHKVSRRQLKALRKKLMGERLALCVRLRKTKKYIEEIDGILDGHKEGSSDQEESDGNLLWTHSVMV